MKGWMLRWSHGPGDGLFWMCRHEHPPRVERDVHGDVRIHVGGDRPTTIHLSLDTTFSIFPFEEQQKAAEAPFKPVVSEGMH